MEFLAKMKKVKLERIEKMNKVEMEKNAKYSKFKVVNVLDRIYNSSSKMALAAEFKRASPSKGDIAMDRDLQEMVKSYAMGNASVVSVLTEDSDFKGSLEDMRNARICLEQFGKDRPCVLRKDFIIQECQVDEARAFGADTVLLIVALLENEQVLRKLMQRCMGYNMVPLVEVNNEREMELALHVGARWIGVNNRNLESLKLDLNTTVRLANGLKDRGVVFGKNGVTLFALSGITSREDVEWFEGCGAKGVLVGESLMRSTNPCNRIKELLGQKGSHYEMPLIKMCGMRSVEDAMRSVQMGANFIGMIFAKVTKRTMENMETAMAIADAVQRFGERSGSYPLKDTLPKCAKGLWYTTWAQHVSRVAKRSPLVVGVFMNQDADYINEVASKVKLDMVQLHGDEGFAFCNSINVPCIRVVHLPQTEKAKSIDVEAILPNRHNEDAAIILLDTTIQGKRGGTGATFDWHIARCFHEFNVPCFMAGGLTPTNVAKSIQIGIPFGVDVSSGIESDQPGVKDHGLIQDFIHAVKSHATDSLPVIAEKL